MANEKPVVLMPDELIDTTEKQGEAIQTLLNQQYATMQMLSGTALITLDTNSQFFSAVLGSFTGLGELSRAQLNEQQLYNAAALEGAAAMHLLVSTLSGDVAKMVPLLEQLGSSGSTANDVANTAFGAVGAVGSLGDAGDSLVNITKMGKNFGELGGKLAGAAGFFGKMAAFGPMLSSIAPLLIGGVLIAAIVGLIASNKKKKAEQEEQDGQEKAGVVAKTAAVAVIAASGSPDQAKENADRVAKMAVTGAIMTGIGPDLSAHGKNQSNSGANPSDQPDSPYDPYKDPESGYSVYKNQINDSRTAADAMRDAVKTGNTEVAAQLSAVADGLKQLSNKPADRHVKSEIVINTLRTSLTLSEFKDMLNEVLKMEEQVSV